MMENLQYHAQEDWESKYHNNMSDFAFTTTKEHIKTNKQFTLDVMENAMWQYG